MSSAPGTGTVQALVFRRSHRSNGRGYAKSNQPIDNSRLDRHDRLLVLHGAAASLIRQQQSVTFPPERELFGTLDKLRIRICSATTMLRSQSSD